MSLPAGKLDRRITLQRFGEIERDEMNAPVVGWGELATVWASYEPIRDGEKFRAGETASNLSARFVIRHSSQVADVGPKDRLLFKDVTYAIVGVKETGGRGVGIEITVSGRGDGA